MAEQDNVSSGEGILKTLQLSKVSFPVDRLDGKKQRPDDNQKS